MSESAVGTTAAPLAAGRAGGLLRRQWPWLATLAFALVVPWFFYDWTTGRHSGFIVSMLSQMGIMIIFALSYNMQMGQSGELKGTDCCKDCCKDMDAKHQSTKHDGHSAR